MSTSPQEIFPALTSNSDELVPIFDIKHSTLPSQNPKIHWGWSVAGLIGSSIETAAGIACLVATDGIGATFGCGLATAHGVDGIYTHGRSLWHNQSYDTVTHTLLEPALGATGADIADFALGFSASLGSLALRFPQHAKYHYCQFMCQTKPMPKEYGSSVFWTNAKENLDMANSFALSTNKFTLEMTKPGQFLERHRVYEQLPQAMADKLWEGVSARFAKTSEGPVYAFVSNGHPDRIYYQVERPLLLQNSRVPEIYEIGKPLDGLSKQAPTMTTGLTTKWTNPKHIRSHQHSNPPKVGHTKQLGTKLAVSLPLALTPTKAESTFNGDIADSPLLSQAYQHFAKEWHSMLQISDVDTQQVGHLPKELAATLKQTKQTTLEEALPTIIGASQVASQIFHLCGNHKIARTVSALSFNGIALFNSMKSLSTAFSATAVLGFAGAAIGMVDVVSSLFDSDDGMEELVEMINEIAQQLSAQMQAYQEENRQYFNLILQEMTEQRRQVAELGLNILSQQQRIGKQIVKKQDEALKAIAETQSAITTLSHQSEWLFEKTFSQLEELRFDNFRKVCFQIREQLRYPNISVERYQALMAELVASFNTDGYSQALTGHGIKVNAENIDLELRTKSNPLLLFDFVIRTIQQACGDELSDKPYPNPYLWHETVEGVKRLMLSLDEQAKLKDIYPLEKDKLSLLHQLGEDYRLAINSLANEKTATTLFTDIEVLIDKVRDEATKTLSAFEQDLTQSATKKASAMIEDRASHVSSFPMPSFYTNPMWFHTIPELYQDHYTYAQSWFGATAAWHRNHYPMSQSYFTQADIVPYRTWEGMVAGRKAVCYRYRGATAWPNMPEGNEQLKFKPEQYLGPKQKAFQHYKQSTLQCLETRLTSFSKREPIDLFAKTDGMTTIAMPVNPVSKATNNAYPQASQLYYFVDEGTFNIPDVFYQAESLGLGHIRYVHDLSCSGFQLVASFQYHSGKYVPIAIGNITNIAQEFDASISANERIFHILADGRYCKPGDEMYITLQLFPRGKWSGWQSLAKFNYPPIKPYAALKSKLVVEYDEKKRLEDIQALKDDMELFKKTSREKFHQQLLVQAKRLGSPLNALLNKLKASSRLLIAYETLLFGELSEEAQASIKDVEFSYLVQNAIETDVSILDALAALRQKLNTWKQALILKIKQHDSFGPAFLTKTTQLIQSMQSHFKTAQRASVGKPLDLDVRIESLQKELSMLLQLKKEKAPKIKLTKQEIQALNKFKSHFRQRRERRKSDAISALSKFWQNPKGTSMDKATQLSDSLAKNNIFDAYRISQSL